MKVYFHNFYKRAWYFGGAVDLELFCDINDTKYFSMFSNGICLDTTRLIMAVIVRKY